MSRHKLEPYVKNKVKSGTGLTQAHACNPSYSGG
jgi:hypothetical protein